MHSEGTRGRSHTPPCRRRFEQAMQADERYKGRLHNRDRRHRLAQEDDDEGEEHERQPQPAADDDDARAEDSELPSFPDTPRSSSFEENDEFWHQVINDEGDKEGEDDKEGQR